MGVGREQGGVGWVGGGGQVRRMEVVEVGTGTGSAPLPATIPGQEVRGGREEEKKMAWAPGSTYLPDSSD